MGRAWDILWTFYLPSSPSAEGLIERVNGLIKNTLKTLSPEGSSKGWSLRLTEAIQLLNAMSIAGQTSAYDT